MDDLSRIVYGRATYVQLDKKLFGAQRCVIVAYKSDYLRARERMQ